MAPPLPSPITIRLPEDLTAWIDDQILHGVYKDRSAAIREIVDAWSQVAPAEPTEGIKEAPAPVRPLAWAPKAFPSRGPYPPPSFGQPGLEPTPKLSTTGNVPWFILPMLPRPPYHGDRWVPPLDFDVHRLPFEACVDFVVDPMFSPDMYVPFGVWSDDRDCTKFMVEEIKIGGGADLLGNRPTPLILASETAWRNGFPSRLTIDPFYLKERSPNMGGSLPICKHPNTTTVTLRRTGAVPATPNEHNRGLLDRRVMTWSGPEAAVPSYVNTDETGATGAAFQELSKQSAHGAVELLSIREILAGAGIDVEGLRRVLGDPFGSRRTDAFRIGILAVAVEHREALVARLTDQPIENSMGSTP